VPACKQVDSLGELQVIMFLNEKLLFHWFVHTWHIFQAPFLFVKCICLTLLLCWLSKDFYSILWSGILAAVGSIDVQAVAILWWSISKCWRRMSSSTWCGLHCYGFKVTKGFGWSYDPETILLTGTRWSRWLYKNVWLQNFPSIEDHRSMWLSSNLQIDNPSNCPKAKN